MSEWPITSGRGLGVIMELKRFDGIRIFPEGRFSPEIGQFLIIAKGVKEVFLGDTMEEAVQNWNTFASGGNS